MIESSKETDFFIDVEPDFDVEFAFGLKMEFEFG
jgi:hypothetical protein